MALSFNSAGYQIEIARAAILSMDDGQYEGAFALGLAKSYTLFFIILPQAVIRMLPPMANEMSNLIKASSVLSVITVFELHIIFVMCLVIVTLFAFLVMNIVKAALISNFKFLEMLFAQAVLYVAFVVAMTQLSIYLEKKIGANLQIKNLSQR